MLLLLISAQFAAAAPVKRRLANVDQRKAPAAAPAPIVLKTDAPNLCVFGAQSGKPLTGEAAFKATVWKSDVIYVGETHDQKLDHMAQFETLKAMRIARGTKIAVAFEMLDQTMQPALDDYAAGRITQEAFLAKVDWQNNWGFDFAMYKPVFDFIVENRLRALALNVPKAVVAKIARGGLDGLSADEKKFLPEKPEISVNKKYGDYLKAAYDGHADGNMAAVATFENYSASMAAWNESMGARVADFVAATPGYAVLVLAGNGHIIYNAGIPASVKARDKNVRQASFYTENAAKCPQVFPQENKDLANYIWYINHPPKAEVPAAVAQPAAPQPAAR